MIEQKILHMLRDMAARVQAVTEILIEKTGATISEIDERYWESCYSRGFKPTYEKDTDVIEEILTGDQGQ